MWMWVVPARATSKDSGPRGPFQQRHTGFEPFRTESRPVPTVIPGPQMVPTLPCGKITLDHIMCWLYFFYHFFLTSER